MLSCVTVNRVMFIPCLILHLHIKGYQFSNILGLFLPMSSLPFWRAEELESGLYDSAFPRPPLPFFAFD